jgi:hypothetical protein
MASSFIRSNQKVTLWRILSRALTLLITLSSWAAAHEVVPAIADMTQSDATLTFEVRLAVEGLIAGINLTQTAERVRPSRNLRRSARPPPGRPRN